MVGKRAYLAAPNQYSEALILITAKLQEKPRWQFTAQKGKGANSLVKAFASPVS